MRGNPGLSVFRIGYPDARFGAISSVRAVCVNALVRICPGGQWEPPYQRQFSFERSIHFDKSEAQTRIRS